MWKCKECGNIYLIPGLDGCCGKPLIGDYDATIERLNNEDDDLPVWPIGMV